MRLCKKLLLARIERCGRAGLSPVGLGFTGEDLRNNLRGTASRTQKNCARQYPEVAVFVVVARFAALSLQQERLNARRRGRGGGHLVLDIAHAVG